MNKSEEECDVSSIDCYQKCDSLREKGSAPDTGAVPLSRKYTGAGPLSRRGPRKSNDVSFFRGTETPPRPSFFRRVFLIFVHVLPPAAQLRTTFQRKTPGNATKSNCCKLLEPCLPKQEPRSSRPSARSATLLRRYVTPRTHPSDLSGPLPSGTRFLWVCAVFSRRSLFGSRKGCRRAWACVVARAVEVHLCLPLRG